MSCAGTRHGAKAADLSEILPEELAERVKEEADMSMGTEISASDLSSIRQLCDQVRENSNHKASRCRS